MRIGIDFDNTLIDYDRLFVTVARERGWPVSGGGKNRVREQVRAMADGEMRWRELQAAVYGPRIGEAVPREGARDFLVAARRRGETCFLVSHKTRFAAADADQRHDLREAALHWLADQGFLSPEHPLLTRANLFFAETRLEKVAIIARLSCDLFIDDLPEVFAEPGFPAHARRILIDPWDEETDHAGWTRLASWSAISDLLFCR